MKRLVALYGRTPMGEGTPLTESLTSFVGRLATARHLTSTAVFDRLVRPQLPEGMVCETARLSRFLASGAAVYDGLGRHAEAVAGALNRLTGLDTLSLHTLLSWRPLISSMRNGALRYDQKRWCASCLAEWRAKGLEFWEPLLWRVALVCRCLVHRTPFSEVCPKCRAPQGLLQQIVPFGDCRRCGHHLEVDDQRVPAGLVANLESEEARREWWTSVEVGRLLAFQSTMSTHASNENFPVMLKRYTSQVNHGSFRGLVQFLGADRLSVVNWLRAKSLPSLESFLRTCLRLGADPLHIAIFPHVEPPGECYYPRQEAPSSWPPFRRGIQRSLCGRRGPVFWDQVTEALSAMLADPEAGRLSATKTARALGIMTQTLRKRFPIEFAQIQKLHETYQKREDERLSTQRRDRLRAAVGEYAQEQEGVYPSQERVFRRARLSRKFQSVPEYKQTWLNALQEHAITPR